LLGAQTQRGLHRTVLLVIKMPPEKGGEDRRLDEAHGNYKPLA
jgi:hypothetical protein